MIKLMVSQHDVVKILEGKRKKVQGRNLLRGRKWKNAKKNQQQLEKSNQKVNDYKNQLHQKRETKIGYKITNQPTNHKEKY